MFFLLITKADPCSFSHISKAAAQAALDMNSKKYTPPSQGRCVCVLMIVGKTIMFSEIDPERTSPLCT